jgi:hypothetical protein
VPYTAHALFDSIVAQAALSLLWTLAAMTLMVIATRLLERKPWLVGVGLLAVVLPSCSCSISPIRALSRASCRFWALAHW